MEAEVRVKLGEATRRLEENGVEDARRNVEWMLQEVLGCTRAALYAYPERMLTEAESEQFERMLDRRLNREPIQYILGYTDFFGLRLKVSPAVLIPRPETERVVEEGLRLLEGIPEPRVVDVGTGSGCIAVAVKHRRPDAEVYACDVDASALSVAQENASLHAPGIQFFQADVLEAAFTALAPDHLHLIVSNPPYVPVAEKDTLAPEVASFEPEVALYCDDDPLRFFRAIAGHGRALLDAGGYLVFETHTDHAADVATLLQTAGYLDVALVNDLTGRPRIVIGTLGG